jgi:hypothetical protein
MGSHVGPWRLQVHGEREIAAQALHPELRDDRLLLRVAGHAQEAQRLVAAVLHGGQDAQAGDGSAGRAQGMQGRPERGHAGAAAQMFRCEVHGFPV